MKILGLDISSSTIGYGLLDNSNEITLLSYGHLKPPDKKKSKDNFSYRLDYTMKHLAFLLKELKPDIVVVEDYAKKFTSGRSSANTIIVLASFNEICCLTIYQQLGKQAFKMPVTKLRKIVSTKYDVDLQEKEDVLALVQNLFSNFKIKNNKNNNIKKEHFDEADAITVALGYLHNV